jgi:hypothetical protein
MPLRLWAGAWMPMAESVVHPVQALVSVSQGHPDGTSHDCHETSSVLTPAAQLAQFKQVTQLTHEAAVDACGQTTECHDGACQLCGVCHQSASPVTLAFALPGVQVHPLPGVTAQHRAATAQAPLIKPPIS